MKKWKLLEPFKLRSVQLKNRIVMAPMEARLNRPDGSVDKTTLDYYAARARGGVGAIIVQNTTIDDKYSLSALCQLRIHNDYMIAGLSDLAEIIQANGAAALIQIGHGGPQCNPKSNNKRPIAPSAVICQATGVMPREASLEDIEDVQNAFAEAMKSKVFLDVMDKFDMPPAYLSSEALTKLIHKDYRETGDLIKSLGIGIYKKQ